MATTAGNATVDTNGEYLIDRSDVSGSLRNGVDGVVVGVVSTSSNPALVSVGGIHDDGEFAFIPIGGQIHFRRLAKGITNVFAKGSGGNAAVYATVSDKNLH